MDTPTPDDPGPPPREDDVIALPSATPTDERAAGLPPRGPIVALRVVGRNAHLDLRTDRDRFVVGAAGPPAVDLTVEGELVSRRHAVLVRKGPKLQILDQGSTNGTFRRGYRDPDFEISAGEVFAVSRQVELLAFDQPLLTLRHRLLWVLGLRAHAATDAAVQDIATNDPILLIGPPGCEQLRLAQEIHRRSPFADHAFAVAPSTPTAHEALAVLTGAAGGTIYLDLSGRPGGSFLLRAFAHSRPIVAAPNEEVAMEVLDDCARRCKVIRLAPPSTRPDDIPRLLDALVRQEHVERGLPGDPEPLAALGEANIAGLKAHTWPGHFDELRREATRLHALLANGLGLRRAARFLHLRSPGSLTEALDRIGVKVRRIESDGGGDGDGHENGEPAATPPGAPTGPQTPGALRGDGQDRGDD
jgi:hypothetical protein